MTMGMGELNTMQMDVFREIGNIGAGNATTALAKLINTRIDMQVPKAEMVNFQELASVIGSEEDLMVAVLVMLSVDINGMMMFLMDSQTAKYLMEQMVLGSGMEINSEFGEMEYSIISEIGNIISGSYLTALSSILSMTIDMSIPYISIDMAGAILSVPAIEFGKVGDEVLLIQTSFGDEIGLGGYFILIPDVESYQKILRALGM